MLVRIARRDPAGSPAFGPQVADAGGEGGEGVEIAAEGFEAERLDMVFKVGRGHVRSSLLTNMPSWLGAMAIGPVRRRRYSIPISALPNKVEARWLSVETPETCQAQRSCRWS
jgi:hypothetical protein